MILFLRENFSTIIVVLIIALLISLAFFKLIKDKKNGKSSCGCNCQGCTMKDSCHNKINKNK